MNYFRNLVSSAKFKTEADTTGRDGSTANQNQLLPTQLLSDKRINIERISQRLEDLSEGNIKLHADAIKSQDLQSFYVNLFTELNAVNQSIMTQQFYTFKQAQNALEAEKQKFNVERDLFIKEQDELHKKQDHLDSILFLISPELNQRYCK